MRAFVRLRLPDGSVATLGPGDIMGRLASAALCLDDGRMSEAHAMVSLRGRELKLLGLRGVFAVEGQPVQEVVLREGLVIEPARGLHLVVCEVMLPESVLALEGDGLARHVLTGTVSLTARPELALWPRYRADADAVVWDNGETWRVSVGSSEARDLLPGDRFTLGAREVRAVTVALDHAAKPVTRLDGAVHAPLHIVARFDTVHIHKGGQLAVTLDGQQARIITELAALGGPAGWEVVAGEIWRDPEDRAQLRGRWDVSLARLRRRLREARVRPDLVRAGGTGQVELFLYGDDRVEIAG